MFNIESILNSLQHRYPFLFIDRILQFKKNHFIVSIKNVTFNEYYFQGHFPTKKIVPGVLLIESIAQTAGVFLFKNDISETFSRKYYLSSINKTKFKKPVIPGDQMIITVVLDQFRKGFYKFNTRINVGDKIVCRSEIICFYR